MRIYLLDADPQIRRLIAHLGTEFAQSEISGFDSPETLRAALAATMTETGALPDLLIVEVHSDPDRDGFALCGWIKTQPELVDIPLLLLVRDDDHAFLQRAFALGAYDVVHKSRVPSELLIRIPAAMHFSAMVAARKAASLSLQRELSFNQALVRSLSNMGEGLMVVEQRRLTYVNEAICALTGYGAEEMYAWDSFLKLFHPSEHERILGNHQRRIRGENFEAHYETALLHRDGERVDIDFSVALLSTPTHNGVVCLARDIREQLAMQHRLQEMAHYDQLTGLPNRRLMQDRLEQALHRATRAATPVALLFIDLDGFKAVNDTLGHAAGDELLTQVAHRLCGDLRSSDTAARLAGDEFVLILEADILGDLDPVNVAEKLLIKLRRPFKLAAGIARVSASIGVVISDGAPDSAETVLQDADIGMYKAKENGKDGYFVVPRTRPADFQI